MAKKNPMPDEIIVYICDYDNNEPIFAVATDIREIADDCEDTIVGIYRLSELRKFTLGRSLGRSLVKI